MPDGMAWESIPAELLTDCAQLVKANSIEGMQLEDLVKPFSIKCSGNKKDNLTIIYTPGDNLKVGSFVFISGEELSYS